MTIFIISESARTVKVGYGVAKTEVKLEKLLAENKKLQYKSDRLKTPERIALRVKDMRLDLVMADSSEGVIVAKNFHKYQNKKRRGGIVLAQNVLSFRQQNYLLE